MGLMTRAAFILCLAAGAQAAQRGAQTVAQPVAIHLDLASPTAANLGAAGLSAADLSAAAPSASLSAAAPSALISVAPAAGLERGAAPIAASADSRSEGALGGLISAAGKTSEDAGAEADLARLTRMFENARDQKNALPSQVQVAPFANIMPPGLDVTFEVPMEGHGKIFAAAMAGADNKHVLAVSHDEDGRPFHTGTLLRVKSATFKSNGNVEVNVVALREARLVTLHPDDLGSRADIEYPVVELGKPAKIAKLLADAKEQLLRAHPEWTGHLHLIESGEANALANDLLYRLPLPMSEKQKAIAAKTIEQRLGMMVSALRALPDAPKSAAPAADAPKQSRALTVYKDPKAKAKAEESDSDAAVVARRLRQMEQDKHEAAKDAADIREKIEESGMPESAKALALKEVARMQKAQSERENIEKWLELMVELPWKRRRAETIDPKAAMKLLNDTHAGLDEAKETLVMNLAVRKRSGATKGEIIGLEGPPGVGKTTLAMAYAKATGRDFVKLSLGGKTDEKFLRGIPRFYQNSHAGALLMKLRNVSRNAVVLLDEADTAGTEGGSGGLHSALLELLDPEQNSRFEDTYLAVPFDLSDITFIVTGNDFSKFPSAVRDRMNRLFIGSYTVGEKIRIGQDHAWDEMVAKNGLKAEKIKITDAAVRMIVEQYTMEGGVRELRRKLDTLLAKAVYRNEILDEAIPATIDVADLEKLLGAPRFSKDRRIPNGVGIGSGLGVSGLGGSVLPVQAKLVPGTGQLILSGQMGDDMKKSANNAWAVVKARAEARGETELLESLKTKDMHLHLGDGPISGPSAGLVMATVMESALTGRPVTPKVAMTGAIDLYENAWTIGGLREKIMAAEREGYKKVLYPAANQVHVATIPKEVRDNIELVPVKSLDEVLEHALEPKKAEKK